MMAIAPSNNARYYSLHLFIRNEELILPDTISKLWPPVRTPTLRPLNGHRFTDALADASAFPLGNRRHDADDKLSQRGIRRHGDIEHMNHHTTSCPVIHHDRAVTQRAKRSVEFRDDDMISTDHCGIESSPVWATEKRHLAR
jgi:hypothetical protein